MFKTNIILQKSIKLVCPCKYTNNPLIFRRLSNLTNTERNQSDLTNLEVIETIKNEKVSVLEPLQEDISHIAPYLKPSFNFAAYVNKSVTLQELLKLGVNLYKLEKKKNVPQYILGLDFENDIKQHVIFLHETGVTIDDIGRIITKNPFIFKENLDDLQVRLNYLSAKKFKQEMITRIISHNAFWLSFSTQDIDTRLGFFQKEFDLTGKEVRELTTKQPKLITYALSHVKTNMFSIKEEMGFNDDERKILLLSKPNIFMKDHNKILATFDYLQRIMKISHRTITEIPDVLLYRESRLKQRHLFVEKMGKAQFNPKKPNYISILSLVSGTDSEFCENILKCPIELYNTFLKTL